jgi:type II secretion system protein G
MTFKKGFTLIELLIVIAIIGILASVVLSSLNSARLKARDAQRLLDLRQIRLALAMYYDDNGHYPDSSSGPGWATSFDATWDFLGTALSPYIKTLPVDPLNTVTDPGQPYAFNDNNTFVYTYGSEPDTSCTPTGDYLLMGQLENRDSEYRNELVHYQNHVWCIDVPGTYTFADH